MYNNLRRCLFLRNLLLSTCKNIRIICCYAAKELVYYEVINLTLNSATFQDVCRATTKGKWRFPKHVLLATTLRHLYRSKKLIMIINRLGHCESYSFCLDMEIALNASLANDSTHIAPNIVIGEANSVLHVEWDNLNKMLTNIHGNSIVNSTGGIMIQEVKCEHVTHKSQSSTENVQQTNSLDLLLDANTTNDLQPFHIASRVGPSFPRDALFVHPAVNDMEYDKALTSYRTWILTRILGGSNHEQSIPGFSGFISATGTKPERKSTIEYFVPIDHPFTSYSTIRELLKRSELATNKVGQKYVLSTFDLGGCMKALPLIWYYPGLYQHHVVSPGAFHTVMNYLGALTNRKCSGSGYAEILVEAGLVNAGRLDAVLKGKAYAKALFCVKCVTEAMERLLLETFSDRESTNFDLSNLRIFMDNISRQNLAVLLDDTSYIKLLHKWIRYENEVRSGKLGKTAQFWMQFIDHARLILLMLFSIKTNNLTLFHKCNSEMAPLFFAYDAPNYSRFVKHYFTSEQHIKFYL